MPAAWCTVPQPKPLPPCPYQTSLSGRAGCPLSWNCEKIWWVTSLITAKICSESFCQPASAGNREPAR